MEQMSIDQQARVRIGEVTDRVGNKAQVQGDPQWASSDETVLTVQVNPEDPLEAVFVPADGAADQVANATATLDADLGEGVEQIIGVLTFGITGGRARFVSLEATIEDKP